LEHRKEHKNMDDKIITTINLNVEIKDPDLLSELTTLSMELGLSLDKFILFSIEKIIYDINFIRKMRTTSNY
jgi:hypothetical protein